MLLQRRPGNWEAENSLLKRINMENQLVSSIIGSNSSTTVPPSPILPNVLSIGLPRKMQITRNEEEMEPAEEGEESQEHIQLRIIKCKKDLKNKKLTTSFS